MATWKKVAENLVRHSGGTIYLQAKVAGKKFRRSLKTSDLATAKELRDKELKLAKKQAASRVEAAKTIKGALAHIEKGQTTDPSLKKSTRAFYTEIHKALRGTLPLKRNLREWKEADARAWWTETAGQFAPQRANHMLAQVKRLGAYIQEHGFGDNPTTNLRRVRLLQRIPFSPTKEQIDQIIESIRNQKKAWSEASAGLVAFLAFSGCRLAEARAVRWEDLNADWTWMTITGGKLGTKNSKPRPIPVNKHLRAVLERLHYPDATGTIIQILRPNGAINNATARLGLPHLRIHDLRHFFSSWCLESGIDIATTAKWLGHKDGGVLLMKTYGHISDQHSLNSAVKLG